MLSVFGYVSWRNIPCEGSSPGKFTKKELALIVICASTSTKGYSYFDAIILVLTTQFIGYGAVSMFRSILVYPRRAFYPTALSGVSLFETLFAAEINNKAFKLFWMAAAGLFCWTFMPQYIAPTLIGGVNNNEGLGIGSISFDWNNIGDDGLVYPWVNQVNQMVGMLGCVIVIPILYYNNVWSTKTFPFMAQGLYLASGKKCNQTKILKDNTLDETAYSTYSQPYYSMSWAFNMMMQNMSVTASIVHVALWHGKDILAGIRTVLKKNSAAETDPNAHRSELAEVDKSYHLTSVHPKVPQWWYAVWRVELPRPGMAEAAFG
ncbi:hypothetical protein CcCBS67573_g08467, partial [Chytriomyces confervae]